MDTKDTAGNWSIATNYVFDVGAPKTTSVWKLDEGSGTTGADSSGVAPAKPLTVSGATWVDGADTLFGIRSDDRALQFNGTSAFASGAPAVNTAQSFVISARVWLNQTSVGTGSGFAAASQDGVTQSAFTLGYTPTCSVTGGCWTFGLPNSDAAAAPVASVNSSGPVVGNRWVHLVGAYDNNVSPAKLKLWVCDIGTPASPGTGTPVSFSADRTATGWNAGGAFTVGRGQSSSTPSKWWPGRVDDVRVFEGQIVDEVKVDQLCNGTLAARMATDSSLLDPTVAGAE